MAGFLFLGSPKVHAHLGVFYVCIDEIQHRFCNDNNNSIRARIISLRLSSIRRSIFGFEARFLQNRKGDSTDDLTKNAFSITIEK